MAALHFEGDQSLPRGPEEVRAKLSDARFLVRCIPDVQSVTRSEPQEAGFVVRPGFAFVRGTLETTLRVLDGTPGQPLRLEVYSKGIGSHSRVAATLTFAPRDNGTLVHWAADIQELGGLLKAVPAGLVRASAQKVIADVWKMVEAELAA